MANITLQNQNYGNVPDVTLPKTGGGTVTFYEKPTLIPYVIRPDAEFVQSYTYDKLMVEDEEITLPSYSTSAQTIKASGSLGTITLDRGNYYYYIVERMLTIPTYSVSTAGKGRVEFHIGCHAYEVVDIPANTIHSLLDPTKIYTTRLNYVSTTQAVYRILYYSSGTAIATYSTQAYGICQAAVAPATSSGVLTINSPTVTARGHTTYFTDTYFNAMTDVRVQYVIDVYKAPKENLNIEGWGLDQQFLHVAECVNSTTQTLT